MKIKRKWEFIGDQIRETEPLLASLADKIDQIIERHYGSEHTYEWSYGYETQERLFKTIKSKFEKLTTIQIIASETAYCTACQHIRRRLNSLIQGSETFTWDPNPCDLCPLSEEDYECSDERSLYFRFQEELSESIKRSFHE